MSILDQLKRNQLAIISLLVALTALGYNTWRNELTENNRTTRQAGFEMLVHVATLQRISYLAHYDKDTVGGNPRKGWSEVLILQDLAMLMPNNVFDSTRALKQAWESNWSGLGKEDAAVTEIDGAIDVLRAELHTTLTALD